ncbi:hypothetical protein [Kitasatospora sp. NPDC059817]|uniref:hypothetical protein n=1 Tax=Kitasatospora sp. NPDC059817 TaxID=3346961 RepID=UPI003654328A
MTSYLARRHAKVTASPSHAGPRPELLQRLERTGAGLRTANPGTASMIWGGDNAAVRDVLDHALGRGLPVMGYARAVELVAVYEPSGHLRSNALAGLIADALTAADQTVLLPVHSTFPRRQDHADGIETILGASSTGSVIRYESGPHQPGPESLVTSLVQSGDLILTIGPHAAQQIGPALLAALDRLRPAQ